jgi:hypothetical protein
MPYFSRNPILATATTANAYERLELEVFIEKISPLDTYTSLGVFSFISDADGEVEEKIEGILHAAMMADIAATIPDADTTVEVVPQLSRKYYYRTRYYTAAAWTGWTDSTADFVVLGGEAFEEFANTFTSTAASAPVFLHPESSLLTLNIAQAFVYVLIQTSGTGSITHRYWNVAQTVSNTVVTTFTVSRAFTVIKIPIVNPADNKSPFFGIEVGMDSVIRSVSLTADQRYHIHANEFAYLNSKGGWNFLPCHAPMGKSIEVAQQMAEVTVPGNYFGQGDISQYKVWDSTGRKKFRVASGFWPSAYMDVVIQDFLLSRYRFWWNADLSKWMPIIVDTKSASYSQDAGGDLQSLQFEFRLSFENDIPSAL